MTNTDHTVHMVPASSYRDESYGVTHESITTHRMVGPGPQHRIEMWDNTRRGIDRVQPHLRHLTGRYVDPGGKPTDNAESVLTSAQPVIIANTPVDRPPVGEDMRVGQTVTLVFLEGAEVVREARYTITSAWLSDPVLVPLV